MIDWNKFLGRCGIALLFVSLCAIGFEFHFWIGMIVLAIEIIIIAVVSEYSAPEDFECIWEKQITNAMSIKNTYKPTEKLFVLKGV